MVLTRDKGRFSFGNLRGVAVAMENLADKIDGLEAPGGAGAGVFVMQGNFAVAFGQARFADFDGVQTTEVDAQFAMPRAGKINGLSLRVFTNTLNGVTVVTLRVNGAPTALTFNVGAGVTGFFTLATQEVAVAEGDLISVDIDASAAGSGALDSSKLGLSIAQ